ncbi:MAG: cytochrome c peroxidase [Limisphaerales bacterium]
MNKFKKYLKSSNTFVLLLFFYGFSSIFSCQQENSYVLKLPAGFPEMAIPEDNALTELRVSLGKSLFFDPILSVDTSISCASCHIPEYAFADTVALSIGVHGQPGLRNTPSLLNVGYHPRLMRDGGVPTLEMQVLAPVGDLSEMGFNVRLLVERLAEHPTYGPLMDKAYGRKDAFALTRALGAYQRTLLDGTVPENLSEPEQRGKAVFELHCSSCHNGFDYTNHEIVNVGLWETYAPDSGYARITRKAEDSGKFKTPSLRNANHTAPYMHDGSLMTLEEVVEFFNDGGKPHRNKDPRIKPLGLTDEEKSELVSYLKVL